MGDLYIVFGSVTVWKMAWNTQKQEKTLRLNHCWQQQVYNLEDWCVPCLWLYNIGEFVIYFFCHSICPN